jgi:hypothetical protein
MSGALSTCQPRYATPRRIERPTFGGRIGAIAERLGTPLMPYQQMIADVGGELVPMQVAGKEILVPAYREVITTIPRQNGKTTLVLSWELDRCLQWGMRQRVVYTAQTGNDARKKMLEEQVPMIERSPLAVVIKENGIRRKNGGEGVDFRNGSMIDVLASSDSAGHGRTLHLGVIDEAFKDVDDRREGAILPAMTTVIDAQLLVSSTMGTDASTYLNRKVDAGRDMVLSGRDDSEIAYFEWSADLDADIDDPATWEGCMPAWGYTVHERSIRHARDTMSEGEFRRAFLNQRTSADERVIPADLWNAVCGDYKPSDDGLVLAIDANPERTHAAIAWSDKAGRCELLYHNEGTGWLVEKAAERAKACGAPIAYDPAGPAGVFGDDLEREGIKMIPITGRDMAHACSFLFDGVVDRKLRIRSHDSLNAAIAAANKRVSGDAWVWARREADADLSPLVALTLCAFEAQREIDPVANVH